MIVLTNTAAQTVQPGQAVLFNLVAEKSDVCCAGLSPSGSSVKLAKGKHLVSFKANIGGDANTQANLALALGGEAIPFTTMVATINAATDIYNVGVTFPIKECCCDFDRISVINTGSTAVTVSAYPMLAVDKC